MYVYIFIYLYTHTHTHIYIYNLLHRSPLAGARPRDGRAAVNPIVCICIYIYIYIYIYVCIYIYSFIYTHTHTHIYITCSVVRRSPVLGRATGEPPPPAGSDRRVLGGESCSFSPRPIASTSTCRQSNGHRPTC